jgi:hypothetical protein
MIWKNGLNWLSKYFKEHQVVFKIYVTSSVLVIEIYCQLRMLQIC